MCGGGGGGVHHRGSYPRTGRVGVKTLSGVRRKEARKVDKKNKVGMYVYVISHNADYAFL